VSTEAATGITTTAARISGSVDPFASSSGYVVEYGRAAAYGSATESRVIPPSAAAVKVTATLTGLAPGTRYHYRVVASNIGGTTEGADATFTTSGVPGAGGGGAGSLPRDRTGPRIRIAGAPLVARNGRVAISLGCPLTEPLGCRGRVRLATVRRFAAGASTGAPRRVLRLGTARFRIGGGQTRAVTIVVSLRGRALVGRLGRLRVRAIAVAEDSAGNRRTTVRRLIMRRV
jgi:hypothetical protein